MQSLDPYLDLLSNRSSVFFVSIGANDGIYGDPLRTHILRHGWHGIMVEPVPELFDALQENYQTSSGIIFECAAIGDTSGRFPFYRVQFDQGPEWLNQLGSFDRDVIASHKEFFPEIEDYIVKMDVNCLTFADLLEKHSCQCMDVLMIDTEGYDYQILRQLSLDECRPGIVIYEHKHLSPENRASLENSFSDSGYALITLETDCIAVDPSLYSGRSD